MRIHADDFLIRTEFHLLADPDAVLIFVVDDDAGNTTGDVQYAKRQIGISLQPHVEVVPESLLANDFASGILEESRRGWRSENDFVVIVRHDLLQIMRIPFFGPLLCKLTRLLQR